MVLSKDSGEVLGAPRDLTPSQKRRIRRKRFQAAKAAKEPQINGNVKHNTNNKDTERTNILELNQINKTIHQKAVHTRKENISELNNQVGNMSSKEIPVKSREEVLAAREAKKLAKQKGKNKGETQNNIKQENVGNDVQKVQNESNSNHVKNDIQQIITTTDHVVTKNNVHSLPEPHVNEKRSDKLVNSLKSEDEVDRAFVDAEPIKTEVNSKSKEQILLERAAKKAAKQSIKKGATEKGDASVNNDLTIKDVVETLRDIATLAKEVKEVTEKVSTIDLSGKKSDNKTNEEIGKSKAELRAERRAKQEAQRAAKQAALEQKASAKEVKPPGKPADKVETTVKPDKEAIKVKSTKPKTKQKPKTKPDATNPVLWLENMKTDYKSILDNMPVNTNLHPAIIRLGVQVATRVVCGSNARLLALLNALLKLVSDHVLPAKTDFARSLGTHLMHNLEFLSSMRKLSVSQENAVSYFRHQMSLLPHNIHENKAKDILKADIERYITDQIEKASEAISLKFQEQISKGDNILTYGFSSLIERIFLDTWKNGIYFTAQVVVNRSNHGREMLRRLVANGVPCSVIDVNSVHSVMEAADKIVVGASAVVTNGFVLSAAGTALAALAARRRRVPVLVACETHKFCDTMQLNELDHNEIVDPEVLLREDDSEDCDLSELPVTLNYDVTPSHLIDAVITEVAMVPCTSAPILLRLKQPYKM